MIFIFGVFHKYSLIILYYIFDLIDGMVTNHMQIINDYMSG